MTTNTPNTPNRFYKFRQTTETTEKIISNEEVFFASPLSFNDPFDSQTEISFRGTQEQFQEAFLRSAKQFHSASEMPSLKKLAKQIYNDPKRKRTIAEQMRGSQQARIDKLGIYCISEVNDNMLLWSHYTDCHKGICIEFNDSILSLGRAKKVNYSDTYPELNYFTSTPDELDDGTVYWKSYDWVYEREWRVVTANLGSRVVKLPNNAITAIYFGCVCSQETIERYRSLVKMKNFEIKLFSTRKAAGRFALEFNEI